MFQLVRRRLEWWCDSPAWLFEFVLLMTMLGWCLVIAFSPAAASGQAVIAMRDIVPLWAWSFFTGAWVVLYTLVIVLRSPKWRCVWLTVAAGWWALVTVMFWQSLGWTTGVAVYLSYMIGSIIAAAISAEHAAKRP